jgi:hypothetical protein
MIGEMVGPERRTITFKQFDVLGHWLDVRRIMSDGIEMWLPGAGKFPKQQGINYEDTQPSLPYFCGYKKKVFGPNDRFDKP